MKELTLKQIADWCGGTVAPEYETVPVTGVESDSRKVEVGDLFVALRGERVDGHDFIPSAKTLGAAAAGQPPERRASVRGSGKPAARLWRNCKALS